MATTRTSAKNGTPASTQCPKPHFGEVSAAEIAEAADRFDKEFFQPTLDRLLGLLNSPSVGVSIFATTILGRLIVDYMPMFDAQTLADVTFAMKSRADKETDARVRRCLWHHLVEIVERAAAYGPACRAGAEPE